MSAVEADQWPSLPLADWRDTYETLHRWTQIVGKTRLSHAPMQNHWWNATLYLSARGLTTSVMPAGRRTFEIEFDFIDHALMIRVSDGSTRSISLRHLSVADFYREYIDDLKSVEIDADV